MGQTLVKLWNTRKSKLENDYALCAWALCVMPAVRDDVKDRMTGIHRDAIARIVKKLHVPPCPNTARLPDGTPVSDMSPEEVIDLFWDEFQIKTKPFDNVARWNCPNAKAGESHIWHEKYSLPYTKVLGYVGCRVTSKVCGIGAAERA